MSETSKRTWSRVAIVLLLAVAVALFFGLGLQEYVTLDYLKASRERLQGMYAERPVVLLGAFFAVYVVTVALNLPGATVLGLAAGAVFGFLAGVVVVSFASSLGAVLACGLSRYLFRDWVARRFEEVYRRVNQGMEREGGLYLFTIRLIPVFPFFLVNLVMGLTSMGLARFYWISQLGMLPGTMLYVNAGRELGRIERLGDIASPGVVASLVLLGLFPVAARKIMQRLRRVRAG